MAPERILNPAKEFQPVSATFAANLNGSRSVS
jgi:hypothetical protein